MLSKNKIRWIQLVNYQNSRIIDSAHVKPFSVGQDISFIAQFLDRPFLVVWREGLVLVPRNKIK